MLNSIQDLTFQWHRILIKASKHSIIGTSYVQNLHEIKINCLYTALNNAIFTYIKNTYLQIPKVLFVLLFMEFRFRKNKQIYVFLQQKCR